MNLVRLGRSFIAPVTRAGLGLYHHTVIDGFDHTTIIECD